MKKNYLLQIFLSLILILSFSLFTSCFEEESDYYEITDLRNRLVKVPYDVNRVVCIGASALRLYSYVGDMTKLVGVENFEKGTVAPVRPYRYAYQDYFVTLPSIGEGGPNGSANAEAILNVNPDVVFSLYDSVTDMDTLEKQLGIPVICLSYGGSDPFSEQVYTSLSLIGKIINNEQRANEVINYIKEIKNDLNTRTINYQNTNQKTVYLACNTYNRGKGSFGDTLVNYACFREINAQNVVTSKDFPLTNNPTLDYEKIYELNPDIIFVDIANIANLKKEYEERPSYFESLKAFQENEIYVQLPFNQYYTNLEIALADAYYIGSVVYPEAFSDINPEIMFDEICTKMLNKKVNYYEQVVNYYGRGFGPLNN